MTRVRILLGILGLLVLAIPAWPEPAGEHAGGEAGRDEFPRDASSPSRPVVSTGRVNVYVYKNFTGGAFFDHSVKNLTRYESMDDNLRAVEILDDDTTVEFYEHPDFRGKRVTYRGRGRYVFPAWFWDRASSMAIY